MKSQFQRIYTTFTENGSKKSPFSRPNVVKIKWTPFFGHHTQMLETMI